MLVWLQARPEECMPSTNEARADLFVRAGMLSQSEWIPVPREPCRPTLRHKLFTADAAGVAEGEVNDGAGVGGVGLDEEGLVISCFQYIWDNRMRLKRSKIRIQNFNIRNGGNSPSISFVPTISSESTCGILN